MAADDVMQRGFIQMLNIDTLLVIFNFLSLYDKLVAMRVCKTWHHIISKHHAWTVIDFRYREDGPQRKVEESRKQYKRFVSKTGPNIFEYRECGNPWRFVKTETNVLKFLQRYAGKSLQQLYIGGAIREIVRYDEIGKHLEKNCPNIKELDTPIYLRSYKKPSFLSNLTLLKKMKCSFHCDFNFIPSDICHQYLSYISKLSRLQILDITISDLPLAGMDTLSKMTHLRELDLKINELHTGKLFTDNFESTIGKLFFLRVFRLTLSSRSYSAKFDQILLAIGQWTNLEILALCCKCVTCHFTKEAFETMVSGLINLETLELEVNEMVTSSVVVLIGTHLQKLISLMLCGDEGDEGVSSEAFKMMISGLLYLETLELKGRIVTSSTVELIGIHLKKLKSLALSPEFRGSDFAESLQTLSHHPTLENLMVKQSYRGEKNWIRKLYSVLLTLPRIGKVKMEVKKLEFGDIENINLAIDSAEVQVESRFQDAGSHDQALSGWRLWTEEITPGTVAKERKWKRMTTNYKAKAEDE